MTVIYKVLVNLVALMVVSSSSSGNSGTLNIHLTNGSNFSLNVAECPGGVFFKERVLIQRMCISNGHFLGRPNGCNLKSSFPFGGPDSKCLSSSNGIIIRAFTSFKTEGNLKRTNLVTNKYATQRLSSKYNFKVLLKQMNIADGRKFDVFQRMLNNPQFDSSEGERLFAKSEIWNGSAYCLQNRNRRLTPMIPICEAKRSSRKIRSVSPNYPPSLQTGRIRAVNAPRLMRSSDFESYVGFPPGADPYARYRPAPFRDSYAIRKRQTSLGSPRRNYGHKENMRSEKDFATSRQNYQKPTEPEVKEPLQRFCPPICSKPPYTHKLNVTINIVNKPRRIYVSYN
ncbi:unnamed protein product [Allacma fusca]|uniref:Uncharacterized protein n=1 Tax=Allacma fusca TaxID=39272 RepID=A0A8J2Q7N6_9HEXA|nr:unnamed protein product [Allacma fusca]